MEWKVENALSRDVERQHLNKILKEIRTAIDAVDIDAGGPAQDIAEQIGAMVENNTEIGLSVTYDPDNEVLNFVADNFVITLAGDVTGSAEVVGLNSVTIQTEIDPAARGVEEAPTDGIPYWRIDGEWEDVGDNLVAIRVLSGLGFPARAGIGDWNIRQFEADAGELVVANPDGVAGNVSYGLAEVVPGTGGVLTAIETDEFGRIVEQHPVVITGTAGEIEVADGDGALGAPTISLAEVPNTGVGISPVKIYTRDEFGRIEGDQNADTDDLPEGGNLYFTDERAQDAVGNILQGVGGDVELHYADGTPLIFANLSGAILAVISSALQPGDNVSELVNDVGYLESVQAGSGISIDVTDPLNPIIINTGGGGTVTSVDIDDATGISFSGGPITGSGTFTPTLSANLQAWSGLATSAKEDAFSKGDLIQGANVTLTGTLTGRLVGSGNVTIAATGGGTVDTITAADSTVVIDSSDPANPTVRFTHLPTNTIVGRNDAGTGVAEALTATEVRTLLNVANGSQPGTVTSVNVTTTGPLSISGGPVTTSGSIQVDFNTTTSRRALMSAGLGVQPSFRALEYLDLPPEIASGTYTAILTGVTNIDSVTGGAGHYIRVGNEVQVDVECTVDATALAATTFRVSLPIASNFATTTDATGQATIGTAAGLVLANAANDVAQVQFTATSTSAVAGRVSFTYTII